MDVDVTSQPRQEAKILVVFPGQSIAIGAGNTVGQHFGVGLPRHVGEEVSRLSVDLQPTSRHHARCQSRIVIWCEIEIIRDRRFDPAAACRAEDRRQKSGFALVRQRKIQIGRIEYRHPLEDDARVARRSNQARAIQVDFARGEVPIVVAGDAGRVAKILQLVAVLADKEQVLGVASRCVVANVEFGLVEKPGFVAALELGLGATDPIGAAPHQHVALGPDFLGHKIVVQPVGEHGLAARSQLDLARALNPFFTFAFEQIRTKVDSVPVRCGTWLERLGRRRHQNRRELESRWCIGCIR